MMMGGEEMELSKVDTELLLTELINRRAVSYLAIEKGQRAKVGREGDHGQFFDGPGMVMYYKEPGQEEVFMKLAEGKISVNKARKALGLKPIEGGDVQLDEKFLKHIRNLENESRW
ncbi:hypothetical protein [Bacillus phage YungSlug]|nr:hypothetical protein [Bacillus phage YungSlug]